MDNKRAAKLISGNLKNIYGYAFARLYDKDDVDDLTSEIVCEVLKSADRIKNDDAFWAFLWKVAENTFRKFIKQKERRNSVLPMSEYDSDDHSEPSPEDKLIDIENVSESLMLLRRELLLLSKTHREVCLAYYFQNKSCTEIAAEQNISLDMVKYHLFKTRKLLKEGIGMERKFGEKSYRPSIFKIDFWGSKAGDSGEYNDFQRRKIKGNILLAAYYSPVTLQEISIEVGVALPYLEDEIKLLEERQYIVCKNGKYLTNIPIFTHDCTKAIEGNLKVITDDTAKEFIKVSDKFLSLFGKRFDDENLARWQKVLICLHYALTDSENDLKKNYGMLPSDGPYSLINGGGGHGIIWGRCVDDITGEKSPKRIQGIYNGCSSSDGRGSVIAMNFRQTLNAQHFMADMTDPLVCTSVDCFDHLPDEWQQRLITLGYANNGKANFAVWSIDEYNELRTMLEKCISILSDLNRKTSEIAANITADLAPAHIRRTAEYVGAFVYRFNSIENLVNALYEMEWLKSVDDKAKPGICVVKN